MAFRPFARRHGRGCPVSRRLRWGRAAFCLAGANYNQIRARPRWGRLCVAGIAPAGALRGVGARLPRPGPSDAHPALW